MELLSSLGASDWIALVAALVALFSLLVTFRSYVIQRKVEADKELLSQLALTLERAFNAIAPNGAQDDPIPDRLAWLTGARHILGYRDLKSRLKTDLYITLCNEHEEYWRHNFYLVLQRIQNQQFYSSDKEQIEPRSAAVVLGFSAWPDHKKDPIDLADFSLEVKQGRLFSPLFLHFRSYIENKHNNLYNEDLK